MKRALLISPILFVSSLCFSFGAEGATSLPEACLTSAVGLETARHGALTLENYAARLSADGSQLSVREVTLADGVKILDNAALTDANAFGALGALVLLHSKTPAACNTDASHAALRSIAKEIAHGAQPELVWHEAKLARNGHGYLAKTVHVRFAPVSGKPDRIRITMDATGISALDGSAVPQNAAADVDLPLRALSDAASGTTSVPLVASGETLTVNNVHAAYGQSSVDGHGYIQSGSSWRDSISRMHLEIGHMADLLSAVRAHTSAGVTTALAMAQFMGHREGDKVSWDVGLNNGVVDVNNVPLPLTLP